MDIQMAPRDYVVASNKYGKYCIPGEAARKPKKYPMADTIIKGDVNEPGTLEFISAEYSSGDIVHAGAFFGDFLPFLSQICNFSSKVWAFEPHPTSYECAKSTISMNGLNNVILKPYALTKENGQFVMRLRDNQGDYRGGGSHLTNSKTGGTGYVEGRKLDELIETKDKVSLIHLDLEGHEEDALKGAIDIIHKWSPTLILEIWENTNIENSSWFKGNITSFGYEKVYKSGMNHMFKRNM